MYKSPKKILLLPFQGKGILIEVSILFTFELNAELSCY